MSGKHCRLYDENLVHNIILSTGLSIMEYLKENQAADVQEICEFLEISAGSIIEDTIEQLNTDEDNIEKENFDKIDPPEENWPFPNEDEK